MLDELLMHFGCVLKKPYKFELFFFHLIYVELFAEYLATNNTEISEPTKFV